MLEVASEPEQRRRGLMGREHLQDNAGMLFEYQQLRPADHGFWMYQTLIPLDIAYLGAQGEIVSGCRVVLTPQVPLDCDCFTVYDTNGNRPGTRDTRFLLLQLRFLLPQRLFTRA